MKFLWLEHNDSLLELQISIHSCKHESVQIQGTVVDPLAVALVMTLMRTREKKIKNQKAESQRPLDHEGYRGRKKELSSQNTILMYHYQAALFSSDVTL